MRFMLCDDQRGSVTLAPEGAEAGARQACAVTPPKVAGFPRVQCRCPCDLGISVTSDSVSVESRFTALGTFYRLQKGQQRET